MRNEIRKLAMVGLTLLTVCAASGSAQQTTSETKTFEVIAVNGNTLVVRLPEGTREITVPDTFRFTVDGKQMSVRELQPGMSGTATITTTTLVKPVTVTEVKEAVVEHVTSNQILVRGPEGYRNFMESDISKRGIQLYRNGKPIRFDSLKSGDRVTATIVTEGPPVVMTQQQVQATLAKAGAPAAAVGSTGAAAAAPASTQAAAAPARTLPSTASPLPLLGLVGAISAIMAALLTIRRRRQAAD